MFLKPFKKRTFNINNNEIKLPEGFKLHDVKDHYYWYVMKAGISDNVFWNESIAFVNGVLMDMNTYDQWLSYQIERRRN